MTHARRFEFTSQEQSYGAWLGKTADLGIITAVFFRERIPRAWGVGRAHGRAAPGGAGSGTGRREPG